MTSASPRLACDHYAFRVVSFGSNRRRQIKEIPWRLPKGSIGLRITGRPAIFLMSGRISFTLILMGAPNGCPTGDYQADLTIVEPYT
jgi:hypothetical protein